jgi:hypothetical protein
VVPAFIAIAIIGFVVGHHGARKARAEKTHTASVASVLLDYPSTWQPGGATPQIPGLPIGNPLGLARAGHAAQAGLVAGQLPGGEPSPIPRALITLLKQLPTTEVVDLLGNQAYRYPRLQVPGFAPEVTLYTIPNPGGEATALACYASAGYAADLRTCEHIVATLTLVGQSQSYDLTPNTTYATQLTASITALDQQRLVLRREMSVEVPSLALERTAIRLSAVFAHAAESLAPLEPSPAAGRAQGALASALMQARAAYAAFATAVKEGGPAGMNTARQRVYEAETKVDQALEDFALLGYKQA